MENNKKINKALSLKSQNNKRNYRSDLYNLEDQEETLKFRKPYIKELKIPFIEEIEKLKEEKERLKAKIKNQAVQIKKLQDKEMN